METKTFYKKLISTEGLTKEEWLKWRQRGIGGSDVASVCNINPWKSSLALWHEKIMKVGEEVEENLPAELGIFLEPFMKMRLEDWIKKNEGIEIFSPFVPYILQHPTNKIALANVDGIINHPERGYCIAEYKTTSERNYKEWQDDNLPDYYYLQVQHYLYVTNFRYCYLAFLIGNRKFDVLIIERNEEVIKEIVGKTDYFWNNFVIPKTPPAPSGDISSGEALRSMYPREEEGKIIDVTGDVDIEHNFAKIDFVNEQIKGMKEELEVNKQAVKAKMGDAEVLICGEKKSTWKEVERKEYIVKASKFRMFRISNYKGGKN